MTTAAERLNERAEAVEMLVEVAQDYGRDGKTLTLLVSGLSGDEWDELPGVHLGPRVKREQVGPHTIDYRQGEGL